MIINKMGKINEKKNHSHLECWHLFLYIKYTQCQKPHFQNNVYERKLLNTLILPCDSL